MKEIRAINDSEFRVSPVSRQIEGYALLFNSLSKDLGGFTEIIAPEALNGVIEVSDVLALFNHDDDRVLARNTYGKGTLSLNVDQKGLKYSFNAPKTAIGDELYDAINRGDLRNSSFAFTVSDSGQKWEKNSDGTFTRTITQFDKLYDVSPCWIPAYQDTTVAARSLDLVKNNELNMEERDTNIIVNIEVEKEEEEEEDCAGESTSDCCPNCGKECDSNFCPDCGTPCEPTCDTTDSTEPELVEIVYNGNSYTIPISVIEPFITDTTDTVDSTYVEMDSCKKREIEEYLSALETEIEQLKKQSN